MDRSVAYVIEHGANRIAICTGASIVAGSAPDCDLRLPADLPAELAEPRHARFFLENGDLWVEHLGSAADFGTSVNGEPVGLARLREGDRVLLGFVSVKVRLAEPLEVNATRYGEP